MSVRYNPIVGGIILALGLLNLGLGVWLLLLGEFAISLILGLMFSLIGFMYFRRSYFIVSERSVIVQALIGPLKREFPFSSQQDLKLENGRLEVREGTGWKRVPVQRIMAHQADWKALENRLGS